MSLIQTLVLIGILVACVYFIMENMNNDDSNEKFSDKQFEFQPTLENFDGVEVEHMTPSNESNEPNEIAKTNANEDPPKQQVHAEPSEKGCDCDNTLNSKDLLPNNTSHDWDSYCKGSASVQIDPTDFLLEPIIQQTLGPTLRNANLQIRSEPPNPQMQVSPITIYNCSRSTQKTI